MNPANRSGPDVAFICGDTLLAEQCRLIVHRETDWTFAVFPRVEEFVSNSPSRYGLVILPSRDLLEISRVKNTVRIAYGPAEDLRSSFLLASRDFLRTPFSASELVIRGEAALLRDVLKTEAGTIVFYTDSMYCAGRSVPLKYCEYEMMRLFARATDNLVSRSALSAAFGYPEEASRSIDMRISRLRRKLRALISGAPRVTIRSIRGVGYQLVGESK